MLSHHLKEDFHSTAYSINVYVLTGPQAMRLTRLSREAVEGGAGQRIECAFLKKTARKSAGQAKRKTSTLKAKSSDGLGKSQSQLILMSATNGKTKKRKRATSVEEQDLEGIEDPGEFDDFIEDEDDVIYVAGSDEGPPDLHDDLRRMSPSIFRSPDREDDSIWTFTLDGATRAKRRRRKEASFAGPISDDEVMVLSD